MSQALDRWRSSARVFRPPQELLRRIRWALMLFVPLSLTPWLIGMAKQGVRDEVLALVVVALAGVGWVRTYLRDELPHWAFDAAHLLVAVAVVVSVPGEGTTSSPGQASLFAMSMLLQVYGGPTWRFLLRAAALCGGMVVAGLVTARAPWYPAFGVFAANLFAYLLGRALLRQRVSLTRAAGLTDAVATLTAARDLDAVGDAVLDGATVLARPSQVGLTLTLPGLERAVSFERTLGEGGEPLELGLEDARGGTGTLRLRVDEADDELRHSLTTLLAAALQAASRISLQRSEHEVEIAAHIQSALLPRTFDVPGLDIAGVMRPATDVGGDYFDVVRTPTGCFVGIGDVAGHGLSAGLVMLMTQSVVSALARDDGSPRDVVVLLNEVLHENVHRRLGSHEHVTFNLLRIERDGTVVHAGAHEDILVWRAAHGVLERIATSGTWIGASPDVSKVTTEHRFSLSPGDLLLLHTDGVTEARNDEREQFGLERLEAALRTAAREHDAERTLEQLCATFGKWTQRHADDWSLLVVRYVGVEGTLRPFRPDLRPEVV